MGVVVQQQRIDGLYRHNVTLGKGNESLSAEMEKRSGDLQSLEQQNERFRKMHEQLVRLQDTNAMQIRRLEARIRLLREREQRPANFEMPLGDLYKRIRNLEEENEELKINADAKPAVIRVGAWLGVALSDAPRPPAIIYIVPDSPAARANLQIGDVVVNLDGQPIVDSGEVKNLLAQKNGGQRIALELIRKETRIQVEVEGADWPQ